MRGSVEEEGRRTHRSLQSLELRDEIVSQGISFVLVDESQDYFFESFRGLSVTLCRLNVSACSEVRICFSSENSVSLSLTLISETSRQLTLMRK
jgi:hypothetical protein